VDKKGFSRNFRYPSAELRDQVRACARERGFRSEHAFLIAACEHEIRQGANTEATAQFETGVAATLTIKIKTAAKRPRTDPEWSKILPLGAAFFFFPLRRNTSIVG
jgi:hypothetical protein